MKTEERVKRVAFADDEIKKAYDELREGTFEEKELWRLITRAVSDLQKNPFCGIRIPSKLWPRDYAKYNLTNLWKYDLPRGWRLIYYLRGNEVEIVSIILEWFDHKGYGRRFGYRKR